MPIESIKKLLYQSCDAETNSMPLVNDKFQLCPKFLKLKGILGSGAYGIVRMGSLQDQYDNVTSVAVKMLKGRTNSIKKKKKITTEKINIKLYIMRLS